MIEPLCVLLIEDSEDDAFLIERQLRKGGFVTSIHRVDTLAALQQALDDNLWDLILCDYNLPGFDGLMVLQIMRQARRDIPFILISGAIGEEIAVEAMRAGAHDYIKKDNLTRLVPAIDRELREAEMRHERTRVKEMLAESEERYRSLVENIPIGVCRLTNCLEGKVLMANSAFVAMFGFDQPEKALGYPVRELFRHPEDHCAFCQQSLEQGGIDNVEYQFRKANGGLMWGLATTHTAFDSNNQPLYLDCTIEDIHERKHSDKLKEALYKIARASTTTFTLKDLIREMHQIVDDLMLAENFFLALYDAPSNTISYPYYVDTYDEPPEPIQMDKGLTAYVLRTGKPLLAPPEVFEQLVAFGDVESIGTPSVDWLGVPLMVNDGQIIGALVTQTYDENIRLTESDRDALSLISTQIAAVIDRRRAEEDLRSSEAWQRALLGAVPDCILVINSAGIIEEVASATGSIDFVGEQTRGQSFYSLMNTETARQAEWHIAQALAHSDMQTFGFSLQPDALREAQSYEVRLTAIDNNKVLALIRNVTDITQATRRLLDQRAFLKQVIDINPNLIFAKDIHGKFTLANQAVADIYAVAVEDLIGKTEDEFNHNMAELEAFHRSDLEVLETLHEKVIPEGQLTDAQSNLHWIQTVKRPILSPSPENIQVLGVCTDITDRKRAEDQLIHNAFHDPLSGLPNRALFLDRLDRAIERNRRHSDNLFGILLLDLDRFAVINDSLGHSTGDRLLISVSARLEACLRTADTIARTGGDEFAILLEDLDGVTSITHVADRILQELHLPFTLKNQNVVVSASIGIAIGSGNYERPEEIWRDADTALNEAKATGRNKYVIFNSIMRASVLARMEMESALRHAIESNELELHYEPIVDTHTGQIVSLEALVRWRHPTRGLIYPGEFIPFAEETGLIIPLGEWVLRQACSQFITWKEINPLTKDISVSVNLSNRQFSQPDLYDQIVSVLKQTGQSPHSLRLEITESIIMENADNAIAILQQLRDLGVQIHIDDFGTGYSSLVYLHLLPINAIKIDRSFISGNSGRSNGMEIVRTIVRLAEDLKLETIAEGVETIGQLKRLTSFGCKYAQGFLLYHTLDPQAAGLLMKDGGIKDNQLLRVLEENSRLN